MPQLTADRNLLFGILAVQLDFVPRDGLVAAMNAWVLHKEKTLGEIMEEQQLLSAERHALLGALVNEHIKQHDNDPEKSLRAMASDVPTCDGLQHITDADLRTSLSRLPDGTVTPIDPFATRAPAALEAGPSGQRFRILRPHARGGLGEVFVAEDLELHRSGPQRDSVKICR